MSDHGEPPTQPATVPPPLAHDLREPVTTPAAPAVPERAPAERELAADPAEHDHDHPTPRTPVSEQMLARAAQPEPQRRGGRGGGMALLAVLVLLILLGAGIGYLLFHLAGISG
jgi:hypothetical protein